MRTRKKRGVDDCIVFRNADIAAALADSNAYTHSERGVLVTNPPYGERIGERKSIDRIYEVYRAFFTAHPSWSLFAITADKTIEAKAFGRPADRRRKLYNGRLEVCYYQFHGQKPPQKQETHRTK